jgi:hypothetical protein
MAWSYTGLVHIFGVTVHNGRRGVLQAGGVVSKEQQTLGLQLWQPLLDGVAQLAGVQHEGVSSLVHGAFEHGFNDTSSVGVVALQHERVGILSVDNLEKKHTKTSQ